MSSSPSAPRIPRSAWPQLCRGALGFLAQQCAKMVSFYGIIFSKKPRAVLKLKDFSAVSNNFVVGQRVYEKKSWESRTHPFPFQLFIKFLSPNEILEILN
ncbi:hypothetical protein CEXT_587691 [Caerostris extrusa]|uniref:Uncharacterized protein n=1 Tax=Caerostris extrusa TaxID=172846 RepID=A0AAV4Y301_CAEEX|nr:hypothetical protein CEXT_587691 [Caerostris extrusa]